MMINPIYNGDFKLKCWEFASTLGPASVSETWVLRPPMWTSTTPDIFQACVFVVLFFDPRVTTHKNEIEVSDQDKEPINSRILT